MNQYGLLDLYHMADRDMRVEMVETFKTMIGDK